MTTPDILSTPLSVIHAGLENLIEGAKAAQASVFVVDFRPPAGGDAASMKALETLRAAAPTIDEANQGALGRFLQSQPQLVGVGTAREVIPGMADDLFLHAGPPISWERMSGPLRGAVVGGLLLEKMAKTPAEAEN